MKFLYILFVFGILLGTACHVRLLSRSSADSVSALKSVGGTGILTHINNDTLNPKEIRYIVKNGYNIIESLPAGYRRDGTVDYTTYVQDAINSQNLIVFHGFSFIIRKSVV